MFPFADAQYDVSVFGRAYTQSLQHSSILNSMNGLNDTSKVAIVVSLQWFEKPDVLDGEHYYYLGLTRDKCSHMILLKMWLRIMGLMY